MVRSIPPAHARSGTYNAASVAIEGDHAPKASMISDSLDVDTAPQVILGACMPLLAHAALLAEPSIGLLLPCNVVVRAIDDSGTLVEAMDPAVMVTVTGNEKLTDVAADARDRLTAALNS